MRLNVIQCDTCETWVKAVQSYGELEVPRGWLTLSQLECETQHFCSKPCLVAWANRKPVEVEDLIRRA